MFGINNDNSAGDPAAAGYASVPVSGPMQQPMPQPPADPAGMPMMPSMPVSTPAPPAVNPTSPSLPPVVVHNAGGGGSSPDDLLQLKQTALQQLAPLVEHLNQTPEEKFKTTMMMLQASDNPALVKEAYAAANLITDNKARAQALLDVVNEINYFTHHGTDEADTNS